MKVQEYLREDGSSPYQQWFNSLDVIAAAKVTVAKSRLELGNTSSVKWFGGIGEYRINWGPGYRIYLAQDGKQLIVLFGGGTKKDQQSDIGQAIELYQEYKKRKKKASEATAQKEIEKKKRKKRKR
jgi:putative addiction module killer protein